MKRQLVLIEGDLPLSEAGVPPDGHRSASWKLDERTRRLGLAGVASARQMLRRAEAERQSDHPAA
ncbi:MAG: hypothetical protein IPM45_05750 [Acidimicrobiales bacterium]|nr:hypothetical protein [Acidimicrobiales bacterium]